MMKAIPLLRSRRGSVTVLAATVFPVLVGAAGLATEYGSALLTKVKVQRVADAAAYGGAIAYNSLGTNAALDAAVARIATLNGIPGSAVVGTVVPSPKGNGNNAVLVTVSTDVQLGLTKIISNTGQVTVQASAYAELRSSANGIPCVMALKAAGTGVLLSGAGTVNANACAVSSNATTTLCPGTVNSSYCTPNGTGITTPMLTYNAANGPNMSNIHAPVGVTSVGTIKRAVTDPLSGHAAVTAAATHLNEVGLMGNPAAPSPPSGTALTLGYSGPALTQSIAGCTASQASGWSGVWTVTCAGAGPFNFGSVTVNAASATFVNTTAATYNFSGPINTGSARVTFNGAGTYNMAQGLTVGGGGTTAFNGAGTFNIGASASGCGGATFSICHSGSSLSFAGPSTFVLSRGLFNSGGATMTLGSGITNSYRIGASSTGYAINMGGGSTVTLSDAIGMDSVFQAAGHISNGGGSCLKLPAASAHDIKGAVILGGGATLGGGVYTIYDYVALGAGGGGAVTCNGQSIGLAAAGVTLVIGANATISCGGVASTGFCVAGGYSNVTLTAPGSGSTTNLALIGPTSSLNTSGAVLTAGAIGASVSGAFYVPHGPFSMSGGASLGNGVGQCLELIAAQVTLRGGTAVASTCAGLGGPSVMPGGIALVQ